MSQLFSPLTLGPITLSNRIIIAPMCQYSAENGLATAWHTNHWCQLLQSGAGLCILEATAVSPEGRISDLDLGIWHDDCANSIEQQLRAGRACSNMPIFIQLAHAGRKASTRAPWLKYGARDANDPHGWPVLSSSALAYSPDFQTPTAMTGQDIEQFIQDTVSASQRAADIGLNGIELHAAHGYLLHQFLSPLSNQRDDKYGGSLVNRCRLLLDVFDAVKQQVGKTLAVGVRLSATDWVEGGWDLAQSLYLSKALESRGCDFIHVSTGGLSPAQNIPAAPLFQVPFASAIKAHVAIPVIAVGLITEPTQAETIIKDQQADAVALARALIYQPRWPWHAAEELGAQLPIPPQYLRCVPPAIHN